MTQSMYLYYYYYHNGQAALVCAASFFFLINHQLCSLFVIQTPQYLFQVLMPLFKRPVAKCSWKNYARIASTSGDRSKCSQTPSWLHLPISNSSDSSSSNSSSTQYIDELFHLQFYMWFAAIVQCCEWYSNQMRFGLCNANRCHVSIQ